MMYNHVETIVLVCLECVYEVEKAWYVQELMTIECLAMRKEKKYRLNLRRISSWRR